MNPIPTRSDRPVRNASCVPAALAAGLGLLGLTLPATLPALADEPPAAPGGAPAYVAPPPPRPPPPMGPRPAPTLDLKPLGNDRFQIEGIVVDKRAHRLTVAGHVAHLAEAPLEYLAVSKGGFKAYESLLELEASGSAFNLACILIGLDAEGGAHPAFQFDRHAVTGPVVAIEIAWQDPAGRRHRLSADEALTTQADGGKRPASEWIYTGSVSYGPDRVFGADQSGALVGFVHDPTSVVEPRDGLGIGAYGSVRGNTALLPAVGGAVELILTAAGRTTAVVSPSPAAAPAAGPAATPADRH